MDNLKRPASPQPIAFSGDNTTAQTAWGVHEDFAGFTKLELASIMIAQGFLAADPNGEWKPVNLATQSVSFAKSLLEEANQ